MWGHSDERDCFPSTSKVSCLFCGFRLVVTECFVPLGVAICSFYVTVYNMSSYDVHCVCVCVCECVCVFVLMCLQMHVYWHEC